MKRFSILEEAKIGFRETFKNIGLFFFVALILIGFAIAVNLFRGLGALITRLLVPGMGQMVQQTDPLAMMKMGAGALLKFGLVAVIISSIFSFINALVVMWLQLGYTQIIFDVYDTGASGVKRLFSRFDVLGKYIVAAILLTLITLGALIFSGFVGMLFMMVSKPLGVFVGVVAAALSTWFLFIRLYLYRYFIVDKKVSGKEAIKQSFYATRGYFWKMFGAILLGSLMYITIIGIPAATMMFVGIYRNIVKK